MQMTFEEILQFAEVKYLVKKIQYGESWKQMSLVALRERLKGEYLEWREFHDKRGEFEELMDIINLACMLATKLKKEGALSEKLRTKL